jgi:hypothetical protein
LINESLGHKVEAGQLVSPGLKIHELRILRIHQKFNHFRKGDGQVGC